MEKAIYILVILTGFLFTSCNWKINNNIDSIKEELTDLQTKNKALATENEALQTILDNFANNNIGTITLSEID